MYIKLVYHILLFSILFIADSESTDLIKLPNGYFITGRGCGIITPIRYLKSIPEKLEDFECSFIELVIFSNPVLEEHKNRIGVNSGNNNGPPMDSPLG